MRNGGAKELIGTTHGPELMWGNAGGRGDTRQREKRGREKMGQL